MNPVVSVQSSLVALARLKPPASAHCHSSNVHHIGCMAGLEESFSRLVSTAQERRPKLPVIVISGLPGAGKTTTAAALGRYLSHQGVPHQVIHSDMFVSPQGSKHLSYGLQVAACNLAQPLIDGPLGCFIGKRSLEVLHNAQRIRDLVHRLDTVDLPYTVRACMPRYSDVELLPDRLTIFEGYAATHMVGPLAGAQHCFVDTPHETAQLQYRARHADDPTQKFKAEVRRLFFHSPWIQRLIASQLTHADFIIQYEPSFDVTTAFTARMA